MKKIFLTIITTILCTSFVGTGAVKCASSNLRSLKEKNSYTFLVCGIDNAAENTDAVIIFNYNVKNNVASFLQIPRDTYINFNEGIKKINSVYPSLRAKGISSKESLQALSDCLAQSLSINIDGYMCFTIDAMEHLIDAIGGVDINLPQDINISDADGDNKVVFPSGSYHLDGKEAIRFIRYRNGYALGDLGRVDAQKFFLSAFINKLKGAVNLQLVAKSAFNTDSGVVTDFKILDILGIALKLRGRIKECDVKFANIPGVAEQLDDGKWYYFVNKNASQKLLEGLNLNNENGFDKDGKFLNNLNEKTKYFYFNTETEWRILDETDLKSVPIKEKSA